MTSDAALRRGWCPGALTPMHTGDGLLLRVRPRAGRFSVPQIAAVALAAQECGNGEIDLTNRANFQIRGLSSGSVGHAQAILAQAGLIDANAAAEARRNVVVAPLAGLDPQSVDVFDLAVELENALTSSVELHGLPGKFGFAIDGVGAHRLRDDVADIALRCVNGRTEIALAGDADAVASVDRKCAVPVAVKLAEAFADYAARHSDIRRMRDMVTALGAGTIFHSADVWDIGAPMINDRQRRLPIGVLGPVDRPYALGIGLPFGRISAGVLLKLIETAVACGVAEIRPSPSRLLILSPLNPVYNPIVAVAGEAGLIVSDGDPRLTMDVCPGAPACARGTTSTRQDAEAIAGVLARLPLGRTVHVSGCAKGCARGPASDFTFVARQGRYDIIRDGTVDGTPLLTGVAVHALPDVFAGLSGACDV